MGTEEEEEPEEEEKEEAEPEEEEEEEKEEEEEVDPCDLTAHGFEFYANKDSPMHKVEEVEADGVTSESIVIVLKSGNPLKDPTDLVEFATECLNEFPCPGFYTDARLTNVVSQAMMNATQIYKGNCIGLYVRVSEE